MTKKSHLEPDEKLKVAVAVLINGWNQHDIAAFMGVNPGRVNEAVKEIKAAVGWVDE